MFGLSESIYCLENSLLLGPFLLLRQCCHGSIGQPDGYRWSSRPFSIAMPAYRWHFSMLLNLLSLLVSLTFLKILRSVVGCWWCIPGFGNYGIHRIMLATYLKMPENGQNDHFQACRQWSPRVCKVQVNENANDYYENEDEMKMIWW